LQIFRWAAVIVKTTSSSSVVLFLHLHNVLACCAVLVLRYFTTIITTLVFLFVPFNSLVFGYHPVTFSYEFALAATIYLPLNYMLMNYVRKPQHLKGQWLAQVSNHILCFTYIKAVANTLL
jgi:hypothetical protein